jgi:hypothetical protein
MTEVDFITYEDYHTYGCLWNADTIAFYIDDEFTWGRANTGWKFPLHMLFDCEIFTSPECDPMGFGTPNPADMPSHMSVDWVRSWQDQGPVAVLKHNRTASPVSIINDIYGNVESAYDLKGRKVQSVSSLNSGIGHGTLLVKTQKGFEKRLFLR